MYTTHYHKRTLEDLAELLDSQKPSALNLTTLVLVAAEPAPEERNLALY
jgi:hypothetical protein